MRRSSSFSSGHEAHSKSVTPSPGAECTSAAVPFRLKAEAALPCGIPWSPISRKAVRMGELMNFVCRCVPSRRLRRGSLAAAFALAVAVPAAGQTPQQPAQPQPQDPQAPPKYEEIVVVSGSRAEEKLINTPATMSVITAQTIELAPTQNFAELLRSIPGLNITQVSARDINVTSRAPTGTLATGQLALLDGRSLYQDFFGFVMWDFLPVNLNEIKQVEVIRGPASAVWGANALYGVVNVISKSPREMQGTSVLFGLGAFDRSVNDSDADGGSLVYFSGTHAQAINDRWAFKLRSEERRVG